jgi:uncharacterized protein (TIGR03382 family)
VTTAQASTTPTSVAAIGAETGADKGLTAPIAGVAIALAAALAGATAIVRRRRHALNAG